MAVRYRVLGNNLQMIRKARKMSQADMAKRLELSISHYSNIERGNRPARLDTLEAICGILKVGYSDILRGAVDAPLASSPKNRVEEVSYTNQFGDIIAGCSKHAISCILDACRKIAEIERGR